MHIIFGCRMFWPVFSLNHGKWPSMDVITFFIFDLTFCNLIVCCNWEMLKNAKLVFLNLEKHSDALRIIIIIILACAYGFMHNHNFLSNQWWVKTTILRISHGPKRPSLNSIATQFPMKWAEPSICELK